MTLIYIMAGIIAIWLLFKLLKFSMKIFFVIFVIALIYALLF